MDSLVTIAIPVYKRLHYLPNVLAAVQAQEYPRIDLLVSDNGLNGDTLDAIVAQHYSRPYRLRRNPTTVTISTHFNQLLAAAEGEYFVLLADDDAISSNYVSALIQRLHGNPEIGVALPRVQPIDVDGNPQPVRNWREPPALMPMLDFARVWGYSEYPFVSFATTLARTSEALAAGGYPDFPSGNCNDNALLLKLCLGRSVAYCAEASFYYRIYETSTGLAANALTLAEASRQFLRFMDSDADIRRYAAGRPQEWKAIRSYLTRMTWMTYLARWQHMYRQRLTRAEWIRAGFAFPWQPTYYRRMLGTLVYSWKPMEAILAWRRRLAQQAR